MYSGIHRVLPQVAVPLCRRSSWLIVYLFYTGFCDILTAGLASSDSAKAFTTLPGSPIKIPAALINYAGYVKDNIVVECPVGEDGKRDVEAVSLLVYSPLFISVAHVMEAVLR